MQLIIRYIQLSVSFNIPFFKLFFLKSNKPKERVMEVVSQLFREQGFNTTGINQIINNAKVAKASFYNHFSSKDSLALYYLEKRHIEWFNGLKNFIEPVQGWKEKVIACFEYLKMMNEKENFGGCVFLNMLSELKYGNTRAYEIIKNHKSDLQNFFSILMKDGTRAFPTYMLFESCLVESQVYRSQEPIDKTILYLTSYLL